MVEKELIVTNNISDNEFYLMVLNALILFSQNLNFIVSAAESLHEQVDYVKENSLDMDESLFESLYELVSVNF